MTKGGKSEKTTPDKPYEPTAYERALMEELTAQTTERPLPPRLQVTDKDGVPQIGVDHPDTHGGVRLMKALGTNDAVFLEGIIGQLVNAASQRQEVDEKAVNFMLSMVEGVQPKDQVEAMLAVQMAAVHNATMTFLRRLAHVENLPQQDSAEKALNKLARTFTSQMEALKRYRTGGEQKVTVQHVNVSQGGQAIVGNVQGGQGKKQDPTS